MHAAKVILLLLLILAVMRFAGWSLGWLLARLARTSRLWTATASNTVALIAFVGVLVTQRIPGELIDISALAFGVIVFTTYALIDIRWTKWVKKGSSENTRP